MVGIWKSYAEFYLIVAGVAMLVTFGLPMLITPMGWVRVFRWELPQERTLATFLGRTVGLLIAIVSIFAFKAALDPTARPFFFDLMLWIFAGNVLLHIYGAVRKAQPITETFEIILWVVLGLVTLGFYPI